jgi:hypothetical protein
MQGRDLPKISDPCIQCQLNGSTSQHFQCTLLTVLSILLSVNLICVSHLFNCVVQETVNCRYFNCNDMGKLELSQTGTLDCFLYVILYDFRCRTERVTFGAS